MHPFMDITVRTQRPPDEREGARACADRVETLLAALDDLTEPSDAAREQILDTVREVSRLFTAYSNYGGSRGLVAWYRAAYTKCCEKAERLFPGQSVVNRLTWDLL
ncbi:MAG: hypothetical protein E8D45_07855 [Nitrospira sp.]|nr:MAG: hypothetical protein E8D45_07855 [Nitrospira sp.]